MRLKIMIGILIMCALLISCKEPCWEEYGTITDFEISAGGFSSSSIAVIEINSSEKITLSEVQIRMIELKRRIRELEKKLDSKKEQKEVNK